MILERTRRRIVALAAALVSAGAFLVLAPLFGPCSVAGDGAPAANSAAAVAAMFGGSPGRNMVNLTDHNIPTDWSVAEGKQQNVKWSAKLGDKAYGGPVVSGGKVFVATNNKSPRDPTLKGDKGVVMCFRAADGKFLWQAVHDSLADDIVKDAKPEGIASTPAVEGDRLYYVSNRGELVCADVEGTPDGKAKFVWKLDMLKELGVFPHKLPNGSPLVAGDLVFVCTGNGVDEDAVRAPQAPSFIAVDKKTGKVRWKDNSPGDNVMLGQWSNPAYAVVNGKAQVIFGGGDGWLYGFEAETGKPAWKFDCNPKSAKTKSGPKADRNYLVGTPVVFDKKVYVGVGQEPSLGSGVGHVWCIDITKSGDLSPVNDNYDPKAPENKNSGLVWHFGGAADPKAAGDADRDYNFGRTVSTCAVHDGLVYIAEVAGYLYCLDAKTGKKYWDHDLKAEVWGSPYLVDGKVYLGTGDGDVWVFAHGKEKKLVNKVEMENQIYSTPTAADGVLYVMSMKNLYAIAGR
jgi:outer membrane protein assembly factor BamB